MPEFVRVRDADHEITMPAAYAEACGLKPLDKPAVNPTGRPLAAKPIQSAAKAAVSQKEN